MKGKARKEIKNTEIKKRERHTGKGESIQKKKGENDK
jgi:hypothetical protein